MFTMDEQEKIRLLYEEEGKSRSEIARMTGLNCRTVRRYAYKEDWDAEESLRVENSPVLGDCAATMVAGGRPQSSPETAPHGAADLRLVGGGVRVSRQLLQRQTVRSPKEETAEERDVGISPAGRPAGVRAGGLQGVSVLRWGKESEKMAR